MVTRVIISDDITPVLRIVGIPTVVLRTDMGSDEVRELLDANFRGGLDLIDVVVKPEAYDDPWFGRLWSVVCDYERF